METASMETLPDTLSARLMWRGNTMAKKTRIDRIEKEINGTLYVGERMIEGTRKLFQTISYGEYSKSDSNPYAAGQDDYMRLIAGTILRELVEQAGDEPRQQ